MLTKLGENNYLNSEIEEAFTPKGESIVAQSMNFEAIVLKWLSGESANHISNWLKAEMGELISPSSIRSYMSRYVPSKLRVNPDLIRYMATHVFPTIDELKELMDIFFIQKRRVLTLITNEKAKQRTNKNAYNKYIRQEISLMADLISQIVLLKKDLGVLGEGGGEKEKETTLVLKLEETKRKELRLSRSDAVRLAGDYQARKRGSEDGDE